MSVHQARVRSVLSGDTLVLGSLTDSRIDWTLSLAFVSAPRLRREGDEQYAYASRQFLIEKLIGKQVQFQVLYTIPTGTRRDYGYVVLPSGIIFPDEAVNEGWLKLRDDAERKMGDPERSRKMIEALGSKEAAAKAGSKGIWAGNGGGRIETENDLADAQTFFKENKGNTLNAQVERVITGDRIVLRFLLGNRHVQAMVLLAGVRAPTTTRTLSDGVEQLAEPFGEEAKYFWIERILQRTLSVTVVGVSPQGQLVATLVHPLGGNLSEVILRKGLARCSDFHTTMLGNGMADLRAAEKAAKDQKLGIFHGHVVAKATGDMEVVVSRVQTADTIYVRSRTGAERRVSLSSIRAPKPSDPKQSPFQADAKELLRKKLIGKHVRLTIDGKKPASEGFEERDVVTIMYGGNNVALKLVESGHASVIRHRRDDNDKSPSYDALLLAEEAAINQKAGMWSPKPPAIKQYQDYSESLQKAKIQASVLQRQKRIPAIVDFVKGASRFTVLIPRENAKLTFVLSCIRAPRSARNPNEKSEPYGQEAHDFANRRCQQRDVEIDIEGTDKVGGFIGSLYVNKENFAKLLLEEGFASVHVYSAEHNENGAELFAAEKKAKDSRKGIWHDYDPTQDAEDLIDDGAAPEATNGKANGDTIPERKMDYREVVVTNVDHDSLRLKLQIVGTGTSALTELMSKFKSFHISNNNALKDPPKVGDVVSAKFSEDGAWYRARIRRNDRDAKMSEVVYVDYGNEEKLPWTSLRQLAPQFSTSALKPQAHDAALAFVQFPTGNSEYMAEAAKFLSKALYDKPMVANVEHTDSKDGTMFVTLFEKDLSKGQDESFNADVVGEGLAMVPRKLKGWERAGAKVLEGLRKREAEAKEARRGMWEYGDLTED